MHLPEESLKYIRAADEANEAAGQLPGSEHLRQRGTAFIQMGSRYDDLADKLLRLASERMEIKNEADHPVDLLMTGLRRRAFLDPEWGWEKSLDLVKAIENCYGKNSMQRAVAAKSAAAVGMKLADPKINETALALLEGTEQASLTPGILTQILSITPYLRLTGDDLDRWLRFAFHETPSQKR
jgi:hypothetical protein